MTREFNPLVLGWERDLHRKRKKPKRSPLEGKAETISAQDRAGQAQDYGAARGTYGQFEGPVEQSPFYKAMYRAGVEGTSNAYGQARANVRGRAKAAGFGYDQPVAQGAENELGAREAGALADVPGKALLGAAPLSLEAARGSAGMGTAEGQQGLGYFGEATGLEKQYQEMAAKRRAGLWKALAAAGEIGAAPFTGGASLLALPGTLGSTG